MAKGRREGGGGKSPVGHARLMLPPEDFERLRKAARSMGLSISAFVRQAVLKDIRRELREAREEKE